jgi:hypothetical protein
MVPMVVLAFQVGAPQRYQLGGNKELTLPEINEFRAWPFVGSSVIPADQNNDKAIFPGIHHVYIDPDSFRHRQEKGTFPDGTIIVMDVLHMEQRESESGFGYFTTGGQDILISIKDRRVFDGRGWGYYAFLDKDLKAGKRTAMPDDKRCGACHQAAAEDDEVFTQYYPALRAPNP